MMMLLVALIFINVVLVIVSQDTSSSSVPSICFNLSAYTNKGKQILREATGCTYSGRLHAIIGPSGSGKTSLLNVLAGQVESKSVSIEGTYIDNRQKDVPAIFVQQQDIMFPQLSVQETLDIAVSLRGDKLKSKYSVDNLINYLGLKKVKHSLVGDAKTRGISGGERKRLAIGNELVALSSATGSELIDQQSSSAIHIFLDEPTSGLDSFQSQRVIDLLKSLAKGKNTVVASIHQPGSTVFSLFDDITLLSEGRIMYSGARTEMKSYFTSLGFVCPNNVNPAEYYVDLVSIDYTSPQTEDATRKKIRKLADTFLKQNSKRHSILFKKLQVESSKTSKAMTVTRRSLVSSVRKFGILFTRAWKQITRDKSLNIARLMSGLFSGLLFGAIYFKLGAGASTVADRLGLLQVAAVNCAMTSLIKATTSFVTEKLIIQRERKSNSYSVSSYFVSKLLAELPLAAVFPCMTGTIIYFLCGLNPEPGRWLNFLKILTVESIASSSFGMAIGSISPSVESAIAIAPAAMVIFIVFGGLYVVNAPSYLKWVPNCSLIRWAYQGLVINEFKDLQIIPEAQFGPKSVSNGNEVINNMGIKKTATIGATLKYQLIIIAANYCFTYISLLLQKPKKQEIKNEEDKDIVSSTSSKKSREKKTLIPPPLK